jgi:hypothetical protein
MPVKVIWPKTVQLPLPPDSYTQYRDLTKHVDLSKTFKVQWNWANKGVAPCYPGGFPAMTIKDEKGGIVSVLVDESLNMRNLKTHLPGKAPVTRHESEFAVGLFAPTTKPGNYDVFISVGSRDGTPTIALPLKDGDGQRRYRIGMITIK